MKHVLTSVSVMLLLLNIGATCALRCAPRHSPCSRADALRFAAGAAVAIAAPCAPAIADLDDDLSDDDEIPDVRTGRPKAGSAKAAGKVNAAVAYAAYAELRAARSSLDKVDSLIGKSDYKAAASILTEPPLATLEVNLLTLVASPELGPDERKSIGTIKRYGVGADALIMMGGLGSALRSGDGSGASDYTSKAKASLDEIVLTCQKSFK